MSGGGLVVELAELSVTAQGAARPVLDRFSLTLNAGESVVILGEAGSGKEALTRVSAALPTRVRRFPARSVFGDSGARHAARRLRAPIRVAYLPNPLEKPFAPHANVLSQLCRVVARKLGAPLASAREEIRLALERFEGAPPWPQLNKTPKGYRARGALAWGLLAALSAQTPELVLADHAFADLGPIAVRTLLMALAGEQKRLGFALAMSRAACTRRAGSAGAWW